MICKSMNCMSRPLSGHILLYTYICLYDYEYSMDFFLFYLMVILRSITSPYERPMIEVTYGEILFSLYRGCMGDDSSGRVVEVSTCCRPCQTYPGQHQCGLNVYYFLDSLIIKTYMYYVFKSIHVYSVIQKHWWSLILS